MRKIILFISLPFFLTLMAFITSVTTYDSNYVEISTVKSKGFSYKLVYLDRGASGKRIKAKYFAAKDPYTKATVPERYKKWSKYKNIICYSSGTYMDSYDLLAKPVGLTVDNGIVVNNNLRSDMDGLVIVYATGGVVATNLKDKDLTVKGGKISGIKLDLRGNSYHRNEFLKWCKENEATVFQTHLLVYKDSLTISSYNSRINPRERRFLAVGKDEDGNIVHCIIHSPEPSPLYAGAKRVLDFLNSFEDLNVIFLVNLDTGAQDVFRFFNNDGTVNTTLKGQKTIDSSVNLLVYYYE